MISSIALFIIGLALIIYFAEKLVKGVVGTSLGFGLSAFLISLVFMGFDPENLILGTTASFEDAAGIALGSIIGAAMVAIAFAFGITALIVPMEFEETPMPVLLVPLSGPLAFLILGLDGELSRLDGGILLAAFVAAILYLIRLARAGLVIRPAGEVGEVLEKVEKRGPMNRCRALALMLGSLVAILVGSEMVLMATETILLEFGLMETVFGMTVLALLVSMEELARELPAALKGRPEISYGNVAGSILAFFLFNAGVIALIRPVQIGPDILGYYLPFSLATALLVTFFMARKRVGRTAGMVLLLLYAGFFAGSYIYPPA